MCKKTIVALLVLTLTFSFLLPATVQAKTVKRYATKTITLKQRPSKKSKTIYKVKVNTSLILLKQGKKWTKIKYKDQELFTLKKYLHKQKASKRYAPSALRRGGRINWKGYSFTWYSQRVLPGGGLKIPGRHVDKNGFVCDKDGYIVFASTIPMKLKHAIVPTPFGKYARCYDCGGGNSLWRDIYVAW